MQLTRQAREARADRSHTGGSQEPPGLRASLRRGSPEPTIRGRSSDPTNGSAAQAMGHPAQAKGVVAPPLTRPPCPTAPTVARMHQAGRRHPPLAPAHTTFHLTLENYTLLHNDLLRCLEKPPIFETSLCGTAVCKYSYIHQLRCKSQKLVSQIKVSVLQSW
jgi:hypothetical protein